MKAICSINLDKSISLLIIPFALCLTDGSVSAQPHDDAQSAFRGGVPITLTRPVLSADHAIAVIGNFGRAYSHAKSPNIVILWNREFSEDIATTHEEYERSDQHTTRNSTELQERTNGPSGEMTNTESSGSEHFSSERRSGVQAQDPGRRGRIVSEKVDFDLEQAFREALIAAGARLVDRTSIIRTVGAADRAGAQSNIQEIETQALLEKSGLTIEISQLADDESARGVGFKVVCRDIRNARILASFRTSAEPPSKPLPYVAGPNGFERAKPRAAGAQDVGRQLAVELMERLSIAL